MKNNMHLVSILWLSIITCCGFAANPEPVIYGSVTDTSGKVVTGTIRWGDQEMFLSDIFNGRKIAPVGFEHLSEDEKEQLLDHQPGPQTTIGSIQITFKSFFGKEIENPYFNVFFGAIKHIKVAAGVTTATLHDGTQIISYDDSNDLNDEIYVKTSEGDTKEFDLDEIEVINFLPAPDDAKTFTDGIYGKVYSSIGSFEGRIMWDKDERGTDEELDGNDDSEDYEIKFADIVSIEKTDSGNASKVMLRDNKTLVIRGTNDVNKGNRGIWIDHPDTGRVEVKWSQFEKLEIGDVDVQWYQFEDYQRAGKVLSGTVTLNDETSIKADKLVYDMNQQSSYELLYADIAGGNRQIPLAKFKGLERINDQSVELELQNSEKVTAYNNNSVNRDNNGILVTSGKQHQYHPWAKIKTITFQ